MNEIITSGEILLDTVGTLLTSNISEIQKFCAVLFSNSEEKRAFFICVLSFMEKTQIEEIHGIESGDVTEEIENTIELFISILMID